MPRDKDETRQPRVARCSFCDKTQDQVRRIIAGNGVYICDECIALCQEIIADDLGTAPSQEAQNLPKPTEIKAVLDEYVVGPTMTMLDFCSSTSPRFLGALIRL